MREVSVVYEVLWFKVMQSLAPPRRLWTPDMESLREYSRNKPESVRGYIVHFVRNAFVAIIKKRRVHFVPKVLFGGGQTRKILEIIILQTLTTRPTKNYAERWSEAETKKLAADTAKLKRHMREVSVVYFCIA